MEVSEVMDLGHNKPTSCQKLSELNALFYRDFFMRAKDELLTRFEWLVQYTQPGAVSARQFTSQFKQARIERRGFQALEHDFECILVLAHGLQSHGIDIKESGVLGGQLGGLA